MGSSDSQVVSVDQAMGIAVATYQSGDIAGAEAICKQVIATDPKSADAHHMLGVIATQQGRTRAAIKSLELAIKIKKDVPFYHCDLGLALQTQGELQKAVMQYEKALSIKPDLLAAHMNLGNIYKEQGKLEKSLEKQQMAVSIDPKNAQAQYNLGRVLQEMGRVDEAVTAYKAAIDISPFIAEAHTNIGVIFKDQGRLDEAAEHYQLAITCQPDMAEAYNNLGIVKFDQGRFDEAIALYEHALKLKPDFVNAHNNLGLVLNEQGRAGDAALLYQQAIQLAPDNAEARSNLGVVLRNSGQVGDAIVQQEEAVALNPDDPKPLAELIHQLQHACAWEQIDGRDQQLLQMVREEKGVVSPFIVMAAGATAAEQLQAARTFGAEFTVPEQSVYKHSPAGRSAGGKIRVGYLSADFHSHATAFLMAEMFEKHDRSRFEITAYAYDKDDESDMRRRLEKAFDHFIDIRKLSHAAAARKINEDGIDILVDLKGYTAGSRVQIPAFRPAPVQVSYIGYPGTMGVDFIDYILADRFILPMDQQPFFSEKIVQLPHAYQPNDTARKIADKVYTRAECGLPETGFVFCSFNANYKITPAMFDVWMRLLKAVEGSVLWLFESNADAKENLRAQASARGVDPARIIFAPKMALPEHLARHACADLFLDTLPVNAHTTASDALWAGLPVLTCAGNTFAGRVAGSLVTAAGLSEMVVDNMTDYEALALQLAADPARLAGLKAKLQSGRLTCPLFDITKMTRHVEKSYEIMWKRYLDGLPPEGFAVPAEG